MSQVRRYGFFSCSKCKRGWESSHVYCHKGTNQPAYQQECESCKIKVFPYKTEALVCRHCGQSRCTCTLLEKQNRERHIDPNKPHRRDLCERCQKGMYCDRN